jgi:cell division septal protein FtsQ
VAGDRVIDEGQQAHIILNHGMAGILAAREAQIVAEAITTFRGNELTEAMALRYFACISEVRALTEELEHRARRGDRALAALATGDQPAA